MRFLNSVLVQGTYTITSSPLPETIFLKGTSRISVFFFFPSLSWSGFLVSVSPRSLGSSGGRNKEETEGEGGKEEKV